MGNSVIITTITIIARLIIISPFFLCVGAADFRARPASFRALVAPLDESLDALSQDNLVVETDFFFHWFGWHGAF